MPDSDDPKKPKKHSENVQQTSAAVVRSIVMRVASGGPSSSTNAPENAADRGKPKNLRLNDDAVRALVDLFSGRLKKNSPEALDAWRAWAWALRNSASVDVGIWMLAANAADPDLRDSTLARFEIEPNRHNKITHREIAEFVWHQVQDGIKKDS